MNYLESYHLTDLEIYCKNKCVRIVIEHHNEDKNEIIYYRGLYGGYLYGKKLTNSLKKRKNRLTNIELYNHLKVYKNWKTKSRGEQDALYDIMNYLS
ncbi:hypothetical protein [Poseidonibacter ostreae]|uniref:Uncharacterized protein n=1 Tax=Poseidonibacter ostreae TaxID=2654171 RepID=A0ABQ6VPE1_9BACT|nr:hypothetical protein [Poseidonibacter ostreae]KAB7892562.1 hypothetical protein GBG18_01520 [Poseidonibacter ostreae]